MHKILVFIAFSLVNTFRKCSFPRKVFLSPVNLFVANRNHGRDCITVKGNISDFYVVKDSDSDREDQKEIDDAELDDCVKGLASWGHG
jgi:hypothetical protein